MVGAELSCFGYCGTETMNAIHSCTQYVRNAREEEDWKKKTRDRGGWKRLSDEAVKKLGAAPQP